MVLRNQVEWAIHCCSVLAVQAPDLYLSTKDLAEFHGVPKEYLSKALQALAQAKIIEGTLGPSGGYRLSRKPSEISFLQIVEAVEGPKHTFECTNIIANSPCESKSSKKNLGVCAVAKVMYKADEAWRKELRSMTLGDLATQLKRDIPETLQKNADWFSSRRV